MNKYLVKYYGGSIEIEAESTRQAIEKFESTYQDHWYAAYPLDNTGTSRTTRTPEQLFYAEEPYFFILTDRYLKDRLKILSEAVGLEKAKQIIG